MSFLAISCEIEDGKIPTLIDQTWKRSSGYLAAPVNLRLHGLFYAFKNLTLSLTNGKKSIAWMKVEAGDSAEHMNTM